MFSLLWVNIETLAAKSGTDHVYLIKPGSQSEIAGM